MEKNNPGIKAICDAGPLIHLDELKVHGTIGILIRAIRQGQKTPEEIVELLQSIPKKSTLHIRIDLLSSIIDQVKLETGLL